MEDEKLKDKISEDDRKKITSKCDETIKWLDSNQVLKFVFIYAEELSLEKCVFENHLIKSTLLD